jgi:Ice-binding-like
MKNTYVNKHTMLAVWGLSIGLAMAVMIPAPAAAANLAPVNLLSTSRFAILAATEVTDVPASAITGDVGLSPAARSDISGLTPPQVAGTIYAASDGGATAVMLTQAQGDLTIAYNDAAGRTPVPTGPFLNPGSGNVGGLNLVPGLYKFTSEALISGSDLTLTGSASDVWIFQIGSTLTLADGIHVVLAGGAQASNIFWQVASDAALGTTAIFQGTILAHDSITLATGATLDGRALAQTAAVTLESNTITVPGTITNSITLASAPTIAGPYTDALGQSLDLPARTITVPAAGSLQFYRVSSVKALTISSIIMTAGRAVITFK